MKNGILVLAVFFIGISLTAQDSGRYRVLFYNVENLFDVVDDSLTNDGEFLPEGDKHWTEGRYFTKLNHIYQVVMSAGEWDPPALIGLCEVENRFVLDQLVYETPLQQFGYRVVHFESPDWRGIDVALLYRRDAFTPDTAYPVPVVFPFDTTLRTRDILYVRGRIAREDTLHVFVNHWPSRYGGYLKSQPKRNFTAQVLRQHIDSLFHLLDRPNIIIMGDLNDNPGDESVSGILRADAPASPSVNPGSNLVNLSAAFEGQTGTGTLKYKANWDVFDQMIVSFSLVDSIPGLKVAGKKAFIHNPDFLLKTDEKYLGKKPFRTYVGPRYEGGFSDHLPVWLDLVEGGW
jgi:hypothetical protein